MKFKVGDLITNPKHKLISADMKTFIQPGTPMKVIKTGYYIYITDDFFFGDISPYARNCIRINHRDTKLGKILYGSK